MEKELEDMQEQTQADATVQDDRSPPLDTMVHKAGAVTV